MTDQDLVCASASRPEPRDTLQNEVKPDQRRTCFCSSRALARISYACGFGAPQRHDRASAEVHGRGRLRCGSGREKQKTALG